MSPTGTYVYCLVADTKRPRAPRNRKGLPGAGPVRLLEISPLNRSPARPVRGGPELQLWAVAASLPLEQYSEKAINHGLTDLEWVSRAAMAHEAVVESFIASPAVLPMKLFTIFTSDERALAHFARERAQMQTVMKRVRGQHEWAVRVVLDRGRIGAAPAPTDPSGTTAALGVRYLQRKKAQHDAADALARQFREVVADLYDRLSRDATLARRRTAAERPASGMPLLLDAAYLVPRGRTVKFQSAVARHARTLGPRGYTVTLTGPWPPYTFMQD